MRKTFITAAIMCMCFIGLKAQITIMNNQPKLPQYDNYVYDSLLNMRPQKYNGKETFNYLVGQTLLFCGNSDGNTYMLDDNGRNFTVGDYFKVERVLPDDPGNGLYGRMVLTNTKTGQQTEEGSFHYRRYNYRWVVVGYYEKIKSLYVGKDFVYLIGWNREGLRNLETDTITDVKDKSIWKCIDVQVKPRKKSDGMRVDDYRCPIVLVFDNPLYGRHYCFYEDKWGDSKYALTTILRDGEKRLVCGTFMLKTDYDYSIVLKQKKKAELTRKYGAKNAKDILDGIIRTGMTKDMCRASWGNPDKINRTVTTYGTSEQWVYGSSYVYFEGNRLTAIQD